MLSSGLKGERTYLQPGNNLSSNTEIRELRLGVRPHDNGKVLFLYFERRGAENMEDLVSNGSGNINANFGQQSPPLALM